MSDSVKVQHAEQSEVWGQEDIAAAGGQIMPTPKLMDAKKEEHIRYQWLASTFASLLMLFVEFETAALLATRHFSLVRLCKWPMFSFFPLGIVSTICFSLSLTLPIAQTLLQQFDIQLHIRVHFDEKPRKTVDFLFIGIDTSSSTDSVGCCAHSKRYAPHTRE